MIKGRDDGNSNGKEEEGDEFIGGKRVVGDAGN